MKAHQTIERPSSVVLVQEAGNSKTFSILNGETIVGTMILKEMRGLNTSILDDVDVEEEEYIYPLYLDLVEQNAWYLESIEIKEEYQFGGIGQQVIGDLQKENRSIFLYSLADAEPFWEKMKFENICGYYYAWQPKEVL